MTDDQLLAIAERVAAIIDAPRSLSVAQAAHALNISPDSVRRRVAAGIIRRIPNMGSVRIPSTEIKRLLGQ